MTDVPQGVSETGADRPKAATKRQTIRPHMSPDQPPSRHLRNETHSAEQVLEKRMPKSLITALRSADSSSETVLGLPMCRVAGRSCSFPPSVSESGSQVGTRGVLAGDWSRWSRGTSGQASCSPHHRGRPGGHGPEEWAHCRDRSRGGLVLQLGSSPHIGTESSTAPGLQAGFLLQCESLGDSTRVMKILLINIHMHTYT